jgi:hypothetical protein
VYDAENTIHIFTAVTASDLRYVEAVLEREI